MLASHFPAGRVQAPSPSKVVSYTIFGDRKTIPLLRRMQDENVVQLLGILNSRLGSFFFFLLFPLPFLPSPIVFCNDVYYFTLLTLNDIDSTVNKLVQYSVYTVLVDNGLIKNGYKTSSYVHLDYRDVIADIHRCSSVLFVN